VVCFGALLLLLKYWQPKETLGFGGVLIEDAGVADGPSGAEVADGASGSSDGAGGSSDGASGSSVGEDRPGSREALRGFLPFGILIVVVVAATGPWSHLGTYDFIKPTVTSVSSLSHKVVKISWDFAPAVGGSWILVSWLIIAAALRVRRDQVAAAFRQTFSQMWGALLVGPIIFGLAQVFNYAGMASTLAHGFSRVGTAFIILSPILGWIGVALSGSNTSANALFGSFQYSLGGLLKMPPLILPALNSVGAEIGKPIAPQTASVGVSTSQFVRKEGQVIRHNLGWTLILLGYLILIALFYRFVLPAAMR
jgi:lactate permease